ncbi:chalcone isomerase family protein [Roseateles amylovorans]|uniref:Chalcone isomerase family protein n=1 Tax=Roseateles amylovorans TaxID=2978473 RepID=A0ABY6AWY6_9BURK|nr:chalcone isomerase family protein [Roseateles amylovorans]UXH76356.1 chalcone isomerase family protein [Roseateles amylovorans]
MKSLAPLLLLLLGAAAWAHAQAPSSAAPPVTSAPATAGMTGSPAAVAAAPTPQATARSAEGAPAMPANVPAEVAQAWPSARVVGQGPFRYFGFKVYDTRLWMTAEGDPAKWLQQPMALELRYARTLEGAAIADRSLQEMRRQGAIAETDAARWLAAMRAAFPNVVEGDRLVGLSDGRGLVRFFHNGRQTASFEDADFARRFFGIWLLPTTSATGLRDALLGPAAKARP